MNRLIFLPFMAAMVLVFAVAACGAGSDESGEFATADQYFAEGPSGTVSEKLALGAPGEPGAPGNPGPRGAPGQTEASVVERKIVTNVDLNIRVDDVNDAMEAVTKLVESSGGFVVTVTRNEDDFESNAFMSFRVPSNSLEATLARVRDISERVERENRSSQDVTSEFVDVEARLSNLRAAEQQLLGLYERSGKVSDVLEVQRELTNVRGNIESLQGRLNYLSQTTATSLVSVWFLPTTDPAPITDPGWSPSETARSATRGLASLGRWFVDVVITIAIFSPVWVPVLVLILALVLWDQRRQRRNAAQAKLAAESQAANEADGDPSTSDGAEDQEKQE